MGFSASRSPSCRWSTPPRNPSGTAPSSGVMSVSDLAQYVVTGLLVGGVYALMSIGLALIFGVMRVVNFAQGDFMMLGMYLTYYYAVVLGIDPLVGALVTIPPFFVLGLVLHRVFLARVTGGGDPNREMDAQLILTLGMSLIITNATTMILSPMPRAIRTAYATQAFGVGSPSGSCSRLPSSSCPCSSRTWASSWPSCSCFTCGRRASSAAGRGRSRHGVPVARVAAHRRRGGGGLPPLLGRDRALSPSCPHPRLPVGDHGVGLEHHQRLRGADLLRPPGFLRHRRLRHRAPRRQAQAHALARHAGRGGRGRARRRAHRHAYLPPRRHLLRAGHACL